MQLIIRPCQDFELTGSGDNAQWDQMEWVNLQKLDQEGSDYSSRFKILYSPKGLYVLFHGEDERITSSFNQDFDKIFHGDVFEIFFHTGPCERNYFEYEISPLGKELVLLMVNRGGILTSWAPWPYEGENKVKKQVRVFGGHAKPGAWVTCWKAELFIPYLLLSPLENVPPEKGMRWNANFCRLDYDSGNMVKWAWAPVDSSFHEIDRYYQLIFG